MTKTIVILGVTKLGSELCVVGVDENGKWIRPTCMSKNRWWEYRKRDIYDKNNIPIIVSSNEINFRLIRHIPENGPPHIEDWEYDRKYYSSLKRKLNDEQRLSLFEKLSEYTLNPLIIDHKRSVCLIEPSSIISASFRENPYKKRMQPEIRFIFNNKQCNYKVTDIHWRAIGRFLLKKFDKQLFRSRELESIMNFSRVFFVIGLTRLFEETGEYHPMIVGVHLVPHFDVKIDYDNI